jgi:hypothetical protein
VLPDPKWGRLRGRLMTIHVGHGAFAKVLEAEFYPLSKLHLGR